MTATLDNASWTDFEAKPVLTGYASQAQGVQLRLMERMTKDFPIYRMDNEPGSYEAMKSRCLYNIEFLEDAIMDYVQILRDIGEHRGDMDRKGFREQIREMIGDELFEADQYFVTDGEYKFDPSKLGDAHAECQQKTRQCLVDGGSCIVANTFTQRWEMEVYLQMADDLGINVNIVDLFDGDCSDEELAARNVHGVSLQAIQVMRKRYQLDWWNGSTKLP